MEVGILVKGGWIQGGGGYLCEGRVDPGVEVGILVKGGWIQGGGGYPL